MRISSVKFKPTSSSLDFEVQSGLGAFDDREGSQRESARTAGALKVIHAELFVLQR